MKMIEYKLIIGTKAYEIEREINEALLNGFVPRGAIEWLNGGWHIEMAKYEEEPIGSREVFLDGIVKEILS